MTKSNLNWNDLIRRSNLRFWKELGAKATKYSTFSGLDHIYSNKVFVFDDHIPEFPPFAHIVIAREQYKEKLKKLGYEPKIEMLNMVKKLSKETIFSERYTIYPASKKELVSVYQVWHDCFNLPNDLRSHFFSRLQRAFDANLLFFLAKEKNCVVGAGWLHCDKGSVAGLYNIATLKSYRKQGVAESIVKHLLKQAFELGYTDACLSAFSHAASIYKRCGFEVVGSEFLLEKKVAGTGIEPATQGFSVLCSTN